MAVFKKSNLRTEIKKGQYKDITAALAIVSKIETQSPFELKGVGDNPPRQLLKWNDAQSELAFGEEDFAWIETQKGDKSWFPFINEKGEAVPLGSLVRSPELGGQSGSAAPPDPHELMTGALIYKYGSKGLKRIPTTDFNTLKNASTSTTALKEWGDKIKTQNKTTQDAQVAEFSNNFEAYGQAISAARAFLKNLDTGSSVTDVYGTGASWAGILRNYKIDDHMFFGTKDYNSSDLIVECSKGSQKTYVGISLKKKGLKGADPTVLNKTVMGLDGLITALVRQGYMKARKDFNEIETIRAKFFAKVIRAALMSNDFSISNKAQQILDIKPNGQYKTISSFLEALGGKPRPTWPWAGWVKTDHKKVLKSTQNISQGMKGSVTKALRRGWPNETPILNPDNDYFRTINKIMVKPENARPIVIALANVIFKTDLKGILGLRGIPKDEFKFTLITGKGEYKNEKITVEEGDELQEYFTTTMIMDSINNAKGRKYFKVTPEDPQGRTDRQAYMSSRNPSKLFYKLWLGTLNFADIEIRYKGTFMGEPQFFAVITDNFKSNYKKLAKDKQKW